MYFLVHGKMGGLAKDLGTLGADIGLKFKENFHVMLLLHSGPQLLVTIVTREFSLNLSPISAPSVPRSLASPPSITC